MKDIIARDTNVGKADIIVTTNSKTDETLNGKGGTGMDIIVQRDNVII